MDSDFRLYHIAKLYYIDKMRQSEIAEIYGTSTMLISRLLKKAEEQGIVKINVEQPINLDIGLGIKLKKRYPAIREFLVAADEPESNPNQQVGKLAAHYVAGILKDGNIIGVSWGKTICEFVQAMPPIYLPNCQVIQQKGGFLNLGNHPFVPANMVRILSEKLSCTPLYLNAPLFVANQDIRENMDNDPANSHLLKLARDAAISVFGISAFTNAATMRQMGVLSQSEIEELTALGTVGDIDGFFIDAQGNEIMWSKSNCCVGVGLDVLSAAHHRICLASGSDKAVICKIALEKGFANVFVTTAYLAKKILEE